MNLTKRNTSKAKPGTDKPHVKRGDTVYVLTGKDRGKTGVVKLILKDDSKAVVEGLNMIRRATKPNPMLGVAGGIVETEAPIHLSNLMVFDHKADRPTRLGRKLVTNDAGKTKRIRISKCSGQPIDD
ncbi:MAG: 50S ribosomal protein L24 [Vampirovibrionales bacterium]|nr:50S ribosomal protein L24 [Vampirovibrionales bacterium]